MVLERTAWHVSLAAELEERKQYALRSVQRNLKSNDSSAMAVKQFLGQQKDDKSKRPTHLPESVLACTLSDALMWLT